jgi:hypothetical protein
MTVVPQILNFAVVYEGLTSSRRGDDAATGWRNPLNFRKIESDINYMLAIGKMQRIDGAAAAIILR